jgi:DNA-binding NtrC family response regulator
MAPSDETTQTRPRQGLDALTERALWKLRVLYEGQRGIVQAEPRCWDGRAPLTIGRRTSSAPGGLWLPLDDSRASREHAQLCLEGKAVRIRDLDSKNGTEVNGRRLLPGESWELADGDVIQAGDSLLLLRHEPVVIPDREVPSVVGVSAAMCRLRRAIVHYAQTTDPVLILGETGTGKGVVAQALHRLSARPGKLVAVNCAAIPETLAESQFFGVQRGAFTGAVEHAGFFGAAHQGTLFLDEVGDLQRELQPKLLRALETRQVIPVGSARPVTWDVRVVAATNRPLEPKDESPGFREDLYERLAVAVLHLVPLRERREDILLLARHLAGQGFRPSSQLAAALVRFGWPRNVRELGNVIGRLGFEGEDGLLQRLSTQRSPHPGASVKDVPVAPANGSTPHRWKPGDPPPSERQLKTLLERFHGNLLRLESETGYSRRQVHRWAAQYGLEVNAFRPQRTPER